MASVEPPAPAAPDGGNAGAEPSVRLRREALLEALDGLRASPDLPALRAALGAVCAGVAPGGLYGPLTTTRRWSSLKACCAPSWRRSAPP